MMLANKLHLVQIWRYIISINKVLAPFGLNLGQIWTNIGPKMTPKGTKIANLTQISFKLAKKPHLV